MVLKRVLDARRRKFATLRTNLLLSSSCGSCSFLSETSMSDEKFGRMQEKAKAGKVTDAYKAATSSCAGDGATKATCVKTAASDACKAVKGTA